MGRKLIERPIPVFRKASTTEAWHGRHASPGGTIALELNASANHKAAFIPCRGYFTECRRCGERSSDNIELSVIEDIEPVGAEFKLPSLGEAYHLLERHVEQLPAGTREHVPSRCREASKSGKSVRRGVEPLTHVLLVGR